MVGSTSISKSTKLVFAALLSSIVSLSNAAPVNFNNYPFGVQQCLYTASSQSLCNGLEDYAFNGCACGNASNWVPLAVSCIVSIGDQKDLNGTWQVANTNCGASGTPLAWTLPQFLALVPASSSSSTSTTSSTSYSQISTSTTSSAPSSSSSVSSSGSSGSSNGLTSKKKKGVSTGAIVGAAIGALAVLAIIGLGVILLCMRKKKKDNANPTTTAPGDGGMVASGPPMQYYNKEPIATQGPHMSVPGQYDHPSTAGYQQPVDPRYSVYSTAPPQYASQQQTPVSPQAYPAQGQYQAPMSAVSPVTHAGTSPGGYLDANSAGGGIGPSPTMTNAGPTPVEVSGQSAFQRPPHVVHEVA